MNINIKPTPRDFANSPSYKLTSKKNKVTVNGNPNDIWEIIKIDGNKIEIKQGDKTQTIDKTDALSGAKVFNGNSQQPKSMSNADFLNKHGNDSQKKSYADSIVRENKAKVDKIVSEAEMAATKAEIENQRLKMQFERDKKRAEIPGKMYQAGKTAVNEAARYGQYYSAIQKQLGANEAEKSKINLSNSDWYENLIEYGKTTNEKHLNDAKSQVYQNTQKYYSDKYKFEEYQRLKALTNSSNKKVRDKAEKDIKKLGYSDDDIKSIEAGTYSPTTDKIIAVDPEEMFKNGQKVSATVNYATGLVQAAPAVLSDVKHAFGDGSVTYFKSKEALKQANKLNKAKQKLDNKKNSQISKLDTQLKNSESHTQKVLDNAQSELASHDKLFKEDREKAQKEYQSNVDKINKAYDAARVKAGRLEADTPVSLAKRELFERKALKLYDSQKTQKELYDENQKQANSYNEELRKGLSNEIEKAKANKETADSKAKQEHDEKVNKVNDKHDTKIQKLSDKAEAKIKEAGYKDKEIENQMAFDNLKSAVHTTSDVTKAGLALVSKKARRKQIEEEGVDAINARNARIAYALGDRSLQTRLAAGKVSPLNSLLHPVNTYKRHQINKNISSNRKSFGFSENPEVTSYYSGEGWQEREDAAISQLLQIDYSNLEEQDFAELRPSQNYSKSLIGTEKLLDDNKPVNGPTKTINSVVESTIIPNHLAETEVSKLSEILEKSYYSPSPAEKFLQEKLSRGFSENEKIDTEYENMLEDIYQRASTSRIV